MNKYTINNREQRSKIKSRTNRLKEIDSPVDSFSWIFR